nr:MAG TPA: hypothetical protein [Caudoviricetes sp.]
MSLRGRWGLRNKVVDCARRRIRGRLLDGGSIPPISTQAPESR